MSAAVPGVDAAAFSPARVLTLDEANRGDHYYLEQADRCRFLAEYRPGGYRGGGVNQLLVNFKCRPSVAAANAARLRHKCRAMGEIAGALRDVVDRQSVERATWVPIPPSMACGDPDYDDRLHRTLTAAFGDYDFDLRLLLRQTGSTKADHAAGERLSAAALYETIRLDATQLKGRPLRECIVLFDDILTTGKHYKCCERRLREVLPRIPICGWFVARRALPPRWRSLPRRSG